MPFWILRHQDAVLTVSGDHGEDFPEYAESFSRWFGPALEVGQWRGQPLLAADLPELLPGMEVSPTPLRRVFSLLGDEGFSLAGRGVQLLEWQRTHRFCGACGQPNERVSHEFSMRCPACRVICYPRLAPAIMVLVKRGNQLLLGRGAHFKAGVFSALAGFVEPGETLEQCAVREVREEVGIEITNLQYFRSQPWPFPHSLMVAFTADYAGGELRPDPAEIEAADWFPIDALPGLPDPVSIARRLIDATLADMRAA